MLLFIWLISICESDLQGEPLSDCQASRLTPSWRPFHCSVNKFGLRSSKMKPATPQHLHRWAHIFCPQPLNFIFIKWFWNCLVFFFLQRWLHLPAMQLRSEWVQIVSSSALEFLATVKENLYLCLGNKKQEDVSGESEVKTDFACCYLRSFGGRGERGGSRVCAHVYVRARMQHQCIWAGLTGRKGAQQEWG